MSSDARPAGRRQARKQDAHQMGWKARERPSLLERWALPGVVALTLAAIVGVILLSRAGAGDLAGSATPGGRAPDFSALDVVSGKTMTLSDLRGRKTLLFFTEGASCQACLVQIADLQRDRGFRSAGIRLVSIAVDPPEVLTTAARQYGIRTSLLSDPSRRMSSDYGMLGVGGMGHPTANGHAFMLLDARGRIAWERAYSEMYVEPGKLLEALPKDA